MVAHFTASQSVDMAVEEQQVPIHKYLCQPQRVVQSLVDPSRTTQLSHDTFRLKMRPLQFLILSIQPTVDMKLWADTDGTVHLQSVACELKGVEYLKRRFQLDLEGTLTPVESNGRTYLRGIANLTVDVDIPPALMLTPRSILEGTGNGVLNSVLLTIKKRLLNQLLVDYQRWAVSQAKVLVG
ncbi:MAG: DUF1997 domain-containing protein [Cyanobacteria bacterium P01_F01_bin.150]